MLKASILSLFLLFLLCCIFLLDFGTVPTVCYFSIGFWNCSNSVVFSYWILELFRQCGIFLLDFGTVTTVLYFPIGFWNCSDSVVFFFSFYNRLFTRGIYVSVIYQNDIHMYIFITCLKYFFFLSYILAHLATVSLKAVSRKRRRKCTLKSYDHFTNS